MDDLVQVPETVGKGMARVELSFDAWKDGRVAPATVEVPVAVLDVKDSPQLRATLQGHDDPVAKVVFAPDGKMLASRTYQGEMKLWNVASSVQFTYRSGNGSALVFLTGGRTLASSWYEPFDKDGKTLTGRYKAEEVKGYRGGIKLWDVETGKVRGVLQRQSPRGVTDMAMSPDGKVLAAEEFWREKDDKNIKRGIALWDVVAGKVIRDLKVMAYTMAFSPDGKTLAVSNSEGVNLWDVAANRERGKLAAEKMSVVALAFAPDGKTLAGCDLQATVHLWDVSSGEVKARMRHREGQMTSCLAFSPDGKTLAVGIGPRNSQVIEPGEIVLWDPATREKRLTLHGHIGNVQSLGFSADGTLLASGGADKTIKLWDLTSRSASKR